MKETIALLRQTERRLLAHAQELRLARQLLEKEFQSKGALGSRGITQFILDQLRAVFPASLTVAELQRRAEQAGYAVPNHSDLTRRLSAFRVRTGQVSFDRATGWSWLAGAEEEGDEN